MVAHINNGVIFLVNILFEIGLAILVVRILLQLVRADFYNPISQLVWRLTQPLLRPLQRVLPRYRTLDVATLAVLYVLALVYVEVLARLWQLEPAFGFALLQAALKVISLTLNIYTLSLFAQALLSWIGPGVSNPAANVLWSLNEPLLRPVRRILPPIAGLDLSPIPVIILLQVIDRFLPLSVYFH
ncbi:MAG: YggT family protein [Sinobacteraceae bacterium]|nr:YggT family protein [Nevskiaceae bacterium]